MDSIKIVLASKSPRRQALIGELGIPFEVRIKEVEEIYPETLDIYKVPEFLADLKAAPLRSELKKGEVLLTSDTVVVFNNTILGKPKDEQHSFEMLSTLSGEIHEVVTGVSLSSTEKEISFSSLTKVYFSELSPEEIQHYIETFKPMDKAGSYGIQEWIGYIGVQKIEGCYYNVMGLPLHDVYAALKKDFLKP
jgi:septum formation protein